MQFPAKLRDLLEEVDPPWEVNLSEEVDPPQEVTLPEVLVSSWSPARGCPVSISNFTRPMQFCSIEIF